MIMTFIAQGIPLENTINMVWVSSEVVHTLVGCFGPVLVMPPSRYSPGGSSWRTTTRTRRKGPP